MISQLTEHQSTVVDLQFSKDDKKIASASYDYNVIIWDFESKKIIKKLEGHTSGVYCLDYS